MAATPRQRNGRENDSTENSFSQHDVLRSCVKKPPMDRLTLRERDTTVAREPSMCIVTSEIIVVAQLPRTSCRPRGHPTKNSDQCGHEVDQLDCFRNPKMCIEFDVLDERRDERPVRVVTELFCGPRRFLRWDD